MARQVFREVVLPIAARPHNAELEFAPDLQNDSYFRRPKRAHLTRADMAATGSKGELEALAELWRVEGHNELLALLPYLRRIADAVAQERAAGATAPDQPSRLIYQMY